VDRRQRLDARPPDRRAFLGRRLRQPAGRVIGRIVGRHAAVHLVHHVERTAEHTSIRGLDPPHRRHRDGGLGQALHGAELEGEVVLGKDLEARRLDAHDQRLADGEPIARVLEVEEQRIVGVPRRLRRDQVGDPDVAHIRQPLPEPRSELGPVSVEIALPHRRHE
jgi:hypothetical protein